MPSYHTSIAMAKERAYPNQIFAPNVKNMIRYCILPQQTFIASAGAAIKELAMLFHPQDSPAIWSLA